MTFSYLAVRRRPTGRWKAYAVGQHSDHISDWRGCNFRAASLPGQPQRGYGTREEAEAYARAMPAPLVLAACRATEGAHVGDQDDTYEPVS